MKTKELIIDKYFEQLFNLIKDQNINPEYIAEILETIGVDEEDILANVYDGTTKHMTLFLMNCVLNNVETELESELEQTILDLISDLTCED